MLVIAMDGFNIVAVGFSLPSTKRPIPIINPGEKIFNKPLSRFRVKNNIGIEASSMFLILWIAGGIILVFAAAGAVCYRAFAVPAMRPL